MDKHSFGLALFSILSTPLFAQAGAGQPAGGTTEQAAFNLSEAAEDFIDPSLAAPLPAQCGASAVATLQRGFDHLLSPGETAPSAETALLLGQHLITEAGRACRDHDPLHAALAANQLTLILEPLLSFSRPADADLGRLDYLGREIVLLNSLPAGSERRALTQRLKATAATWRRVRPAFLPLPDASKAVHTMDDAAAQLAAATTAAQQIGAAKGLLEAVDQLESVR